MEDRLGNLRVAVEEFDVVAGDLPSVRQSGVLDGSDEKPASRCEGCAEEAVAECPGKS